MPILIAESGATKTDWSWEEGSAFQSTGLNPVLLTEAQIIMDLTNTILPLINEKNLIFEELYFYGAGCSQGEAQNKMTIALRKVLGHRVKKIIVQSDIWAAIRATCQNESGFCCILGTGSNSCFYDAQKDAITEQMPSLGYMLGDEGAGYALGKALIKTYLYRKLPQDLVFSLEREYGMVKESHFISEIYHQAKPNKYIASFARFLFMHRHHKFVQDLVKKELSIFVEDILLQYAQIQAYPIHFVGSIAYYWQDILKQIGKQYHLQFGKIYAAPLDALWLYHKAQ